MEIDTCSRHLKRIHIEEAEDCPPPKRIRNVEIVPSHLYGPIHITTLEDSDVLMMDYMICTVSKDGNLPTLLQQLSQ